MKQNKITEEQEQVRICMVFLQKIRMVSLVFLFCHKRQESQHNKQGKDNWERQWLSDNLHFLFAHNIFNGDEISLQAQEISARTITVHVGPSLYNEAPHKLGLYRALSLQEVSGHCFFSSYALSSPQYNSLSFKEGARAIGL
jgi:hypothetical protein